MKKQKLIVFTGAGISEESGIRTFRDSNGLWEEYNINDVATPAAWEKNKPLVLKFYNERRKQVHQAKPNEAHKALALLQKKYDVHIITQNIDDLHERAGSKNVLHLHGEINKSRSTKDPSLIYKIKGDKIKFGDTCELGSQLRPHIVWFGELVPMMDKAYDLASVAEIFIVIGTSLAVYPAAGIVNFVPAKTPKYLIDPKKVNIDGIQNLTVINQKAVQGMMQLLAELM